MSVAAVVPVVVGLLVVVRLLEQLEVRATDWLGLVAALVVIMPTILVSVPRWTLLGRWRCGLLRMPSAVVIPGVLVLFVIEDGAVLEGRMLPLVGDVMLAAGGATAVLLMGGVVLLGLTILVPVTTRRASLLPCLLPAPVALVPVELIHRGPAERRLADTVAVGLSLLLRLWAALLLLALLVAPRYCGVLALRRRWGLGTAIRGLLCVQGKLAEGLTVAGVVALVAVIVLTRPATRLWLLALGPVTRSLLVMSSRGRTLCSIPVVAIRGVAVLFAPRVAAVVGGVVPQLTGDGVVVAFHVQRHARESVSLVRWLRLRLVLGLTMASLLSLRGLRLLGLPMRRPTRLVRGVRSGWALPARSGRLLWHERVAEALLTLTLLILVDGRV